MKETLRIIAKEFEYLNEEKRKLENKQMKTEQDLEDLKAIEELYEYVSEKINNWTIEKNNQLIEIQNLEKNNNDNLRERFEQGRRAIEEIKNESKAMQPKIAGADKMRKDEILEQAGFIKTNTVDDRAIRIHPSLVGKYYDLVKEQKKLTKELNEEYYKNRKNNSSFQDESQLLQPIVEDQIKPTTQESIVQEESVSTLNNEIPELDANQKLEEFWRTKIMEPIQSWNLQPENNINNSSNTEQNLLNNEEQSEAKQISTTMDRFENLNSTIIDGMKKEVENQTETIKEPEILTSSETEEQQSEEQINQDEDDFGTTLIEEEKIQDDTEEEEKIIDVNDDDEEKLSDTEEEKKEKPINNFIIKVRKMKNSVKKITKKHEKIKIAIIAALAGFVLGYGIKSNNSDLSKLQPATNIEAESTEFTEEDLENVQIPSSLPTATSDFLNENMGSLNESQPDWLLPNAALEFMDNNMETSDDNQTDVIEAVEEEITPESECSISTIGNTITVQEGTRIHNNMYDAYLGENSYSTYYNFNEERKIIGVGIVNENGMTAILASEENYEQKVNDLIQEGGEVVSVLTANNKYLSDWDGKTPLTLDEIRAYNEGWYNVNDITNNNVKGIQK